MQTVSVIIPTFNEERYIKDCLISLDKQKLIKFEVIIVDDGSSDETREIIKDYKPANCQLTLLTQDHKGPAVARNLGVSKSKGEVLVFVDADMTFDKHFLKMLTAPIFAAKTRGTFSKWEYVSNWENVWARCWNYNQNWPDKKRHPKDYPNKQKVFRAILKKEFEKVNGFSEGGYTDDYTLSEKLGYEATSAEKAIFFHRNPETLPEVFFQAKWSAKRKYKFGLLGILIAIIRSSIIFSLINGLILSIAKMEPSFLIFKTIYDFGIFLGILEMVFLRKKIK